MDAKYFKMDISVKNQQQKFTSFAPLLSTVWKLYYIYYHLRLLMIVCIVLIWFLLTVLHESGNLNAIFIHQISKLVFLGQKPTFDFVLTLPLDNIIDKTKLNKDKAKGHCPNRPGPLSIPLQNLVASIRSLLLIQTKLPSALKGAQLYLTWS